MKITDRIFERMGVAGATLNGSTIFPPQNLKAESQLKLCSHSGDVEVWYNGTCYFKAWIHAADANGAGAVCGLSRSIYNQMDKSHLEIWDSKQGEISTQNLRQAYRDLVNIAIAIAVSLDKFPEQGRLFTSRTLYRDLNDILDSYADILVPRLCQKAAEQEAVLQQSGDSLERWCDRLRERTANYKGEYNLDELKNSLGDGV